MMIRISVFILLIIFHWHTEASTKINFNQEYSIEPGNSHEFYLNLGESDPYLISFNQPTELDLTIQELSVSKEINPPIHDFYPKYFLHNQLAQNLVITIAGNEFKPVIIKFYKQKLNQVEFNQWSLLMLAVFQSEENNFNESLKLLNQVNFSNFKSLQKYMPYKQTLVAFNYLDLGLLENATEVILKVVKAAENNRLLHNQLKTVYARIESIKGNHHLAIEIYKSVLEEVKALGLDALLASAHNNIGLNHYYMGNFDEALIFYNDAINEWRMLKNDEQILRLKNNIGAVYFAQGKTDESLAMFRAAIKDARKFKLNKVLAYLLEMEAWNLETQGKYDGLFSQWHEVIKIRTDDKDIEGLIRAQRLLGRLYHHLGEYKLAVKFLNASMNQARQLTPTETYGVLLRELAIAYQSLGDDEKSLELLKQAVEFNNNNPLLLAGDYLSLAQYYLQQAENRTSDRDLMIATANQYLAESKTIYQGENESLHVSNLTLTEVKILINQRNYTIAEQLLDKLLRESKEKNDLLFQYKVLTLSGELMKHRGKKNNMVEAYKQALFVADTISSTITTPISRARFNTQTENIRSQLISHMVSSVNNMHLDNANQMIKQSLMYSEMGKASVLKHIKSQSIQAKLPEVKRSLLKQLQSFYEYKQYLLNDVNYKQSGIDEIDRKIIFAKSKLDSGNELLSPLPSGFENTGRISEIQNNLSNSQIIYAFHLGNKNSFLWKVKHDSIEVVELPGKGQIEDNVHLVYTHFSESVNNSREVSDSVIYAKQWLNEHIFNYFDEQDEVFIVPHGKLAIYPWGLESDFNVTVVPSLMIKANQSKSIASEDLENLLIVSNPIVENGEYQELPQSKLEAHWLQSNWNEGRVDVLEGVYATHKAITEMTKLQPDVIHIASHAIVNNEYPDLSGLLLSPSDAGHMLTLDEISKLNLTTQHVVLSACGTANGELIGGEGIISLSYAFLAAGVEQVHATLWPVGDRAAFHHIQKMYQNQTIQSVTQPGWVTYRILP